MVRSLSSLCFWAVCSRSVAINQQFRRATQKTVHETMAMTEWGSEFLEQEHASANSTLRREVAVLLAVDSVESAGVAANATMEAAAAEAAQAEAARVAEAARAKVAAAADRAAALRADARTKADEAANATAAAAAEEQALTEQALKIVTSNPGPYRMPMEEKDPKDQTVVWITSFPRSGSTTGLNMFAYPSAKNHRSAFSVFEPCHGLAPPGSNEILEREGCHKELSRIANCDYSNLKTIGSWAKKDGGFIFAPTPDGLHHEPPHVQSAICHRSDVIAFKTVSYGQDTERQVIPLLAQDPRVRAINIIRDPRGIYASWRTTEPFSDVVSGERELNTETHDQDWMYGLTGICDAFAKNMALAPHPHVLNMKYEDLVAEPMDTVRKAYEHVGIPFGEPEMNWVKSTFDADCKDSDVGQFSTCHRNSAAPATRWREVLSHAEQAQFSEHPTCREVAEHYGYPL